MVLEAKNYTREEQIVSQIARSFGPEDEFFTSAVNNVSYVALALAQRLYAPRILFWAGAEGRAGLLSGTRFPFMIGHPPEDFIEALSTTLDVFDWIQAGKWCIIMQPVQIDKFGFTNLSIVGDKKNPSAVFVGSRGVPDNTVNGPRTYFVVPGHSKRVFVDKVDFVSGIGYGKERKEGVVKYGAMNKVFSNLGVFDFNEEGRMRVNCLYTGVTIDEVIENTGFDLIVPDQVPEADPPSEEEIFLMRKVVDPMEVRNLDFLKGEEFNKAFQQLMIGTTYDMLYKKKAS